MRLTHVILYVADIPTSVGFYGALLEREPIELHPSFAAFDLGGGFTLGLWQEGTVSPAPDAAGARSELGLALGDAAMVATAWDKWRARGVPIAQPLTELDFGPTFVALDPDRHRLRVFA